MPSPVHILQFLLLIAVALAVGLLSTTKKGNRVLGFISSGLLTLISATELVSGKITQRWNGGPPIEGPLAKIGSAFLLAAGLYTIYQLISQRSDDTEEKQ